MTWRTTAYPVWSHGYLLVIQNNDSAAPVIHSLGRDGHETTPIVFAIPDTERMRIEGISRTALGDVLLCGVAYNHAGAGGGFIARVAGESRSSTIIRTFPYVPYLIAGAPDNSIWTEGLEMVNGREHDPSVDSTHGVIRHFDTNGHQIGSLIARSSIPEMHFGLTSSILASSKYGMAWYTDETDRVTVIAFNGPTKVFPGAPGYGSGWVTGIAMTDDGDVLVSGASGRSSAVTHEPINKPGLFHLDIISGKWNVVRQPPGHAIPILYGSEGDTLVMSGKSRFELSFDKIAP